MNRPLLTTLSALVLGTSFGQPGANDPTFDPGTGANATVEAIALQPDGKILIGGYFFAYNGTSQFGITRLSSDGVLDAEFTIGTGTGPGPSGHAEVLAIVLQPDGKVLIAGSFANYNGYPRKNIARLNGDGTVDLSFTPGSGASTIINCMALQEDGKILIGGNFTLYNGTAARYVARLNSDGSLDTGFSSGTGANWNVSALALQPDGKILIGGQFDEYNGTPRNYMVRLNSDGSLDPSFDPVTGADDFLHSIALQDDGKILIGGEFETYNGMPRNHIARLNSDGSLDPSFDPGSGTNQIVYCIVVRPDGKILIAGGFTEYDGMSRNRIALVNSDGNLDLGFDPGTGASHAVYALATQSDGKIMIGGYFTSYDGIARSKIARILAQDASGMDQHTPLAALHLAPNPVFNSFRITGMEEVYLWSITDTQGRLLAQGDNRNATSQAIDVSSLATGSYLLVVQAGSARRTISFIKT